MSFYWEYFDRFLLENVRIHFVGFSAIIVNDHKFIKELFNDPAAQDRLSNNPIMLEYTKGQYGNIF